MSKLLTHPSCGKQYPGNNRHGHCSGCHETFVGITAFDGHRRTADDGVTRICVIQPYETVQESGKISYGHWLDSDGYYHYGEQLSDERKKELWG